MTEPPHRHRFSFGRTLLTIHTIAAIGAAGLMLIVQAQTQPYIPFSDLKTAEAVMFGFVDRFPLVFTIAMTLSLPGLLGHRQLSRGVRTSRLAVLAAIVGMLIAITASVAGYMISGDSGVRIGSGAHVISTGHALALVATYAVLVLPNIVLFIRLYRPE